MLNPLLFNINISNATVQPLDLSHFMGKPAAISMLRIDRIHPEISGNKWFKLKYHLEAFQKRPYSGILSFGGAWSNHLLATAEACRLAKIPYAAIIRGEKPEVLSPVLKDLLNKGMLLKFISRTDYSEKRQQIAEVFFPNYYAVPEGGAGEVGVKGAAEIMNLIPKNASHICCAIGTGTMMAGLCKNSNSHQIILGFSSLKLKKDNEIEQLVRQNSQFNPPYFFYDYHFGGYGKTNKILLNFMEEFREVTGVELDKVYTAKMVYGAIEEFKKGFFPDQAEICLIHSGGLSGNRIL